MAIRWPAGRVVSHSPGNPGRVGDPDRRRLDDGGPAATGGGTTSLPFPPELVATSATITTTATAATPAAPHHNIRCRRLRACLAARPLGRRRCDEGRGGTRADLCSLAGDGPAAPLWVLCGGCLLNWSRSVEK